MRYMVKGENMINPKRTFKRARNKFRFDIYGICRDNPVICCSIIYAFLAARNWDVITKTWAMGRTHKEWYKDYRRTFNAKEFYGNIAIMDWLCICSHSLFVRWNGNIPECYAMADAYSVAKNCMYKMEKK
jgi:hypothetical protein